MERLKKLMAKLGRDGPLIALALLCALGCLLLTALETGGVETEETRIARVLSAMAGAGEVQVAVRWGEESGLTGSGGRAALGAVAVAQGARDVGVRLALSKALRTLLDLPTGAVEVFAMEGELQ